jgi:hypothetical protein
MTRRRAGALSLGAALLALTGVLALGQRPAGAQAACRSVAIRSPVTGEAVTGTVPILGSAQIDGFNFYKLEWAPSNDPQAWRAVSDIRHEPVINGLLDQWDTGRMPDGVYRLKLTVVDESAAEICSELVEDVVVGAVNAAGTGTATETATSTGTATAAEITATPTVLDEEPTAEPSATEVAAVDTPVSGEASPEPEATATLVPIVPSESDSAEGEELELGSLLRAFTGGFCLALLAAVALMGYLALRGNQ